VIKSRKKKKKTKDLRKKPEGKVPYKVQGINGFVILK
jgi:hypothetical protein